MAIEFACDECGRLLRTPDESAGKLVRCVACGSFAEVPTLELSACGANARQSDLPWSAPVANHGPSSFSRTVDPPASPRIATTSGLAWEVGPKSLRTFCETTKQILGSPTIAFQQMNSAGSWSAPLLFGMAWSLLGGLVSVSMNVVFKLAVSGFATAAPLPPAADDPMTMLHNLNQYMTAFSYAMVFVMGTLGFLMTVFMTGGLNHLCLMLFGGPRKTYETSCRVVAYANGAAAVFQLIPMLGSMVFFVAATIYQIIGLAAAHRTTGSRATLAVLLPMVLMCSAAMVIGAALLTIVFTKMSAAIPSAGA